jgi:hypothetical protein
MAYKAVYLVGPTVVSASQEDTNGSTLFNVGSGDVGEHARYLIKNVDTYPVTIGTDETFSNGWRLEPGESLDFTSKSKVSLYGRRFVNNGAVMLCISSLPEVE